MFRYGLVGLGNTGLFSLLAWLLHRTGWHYAVYTSLSYAVVILFSFTMNLLFTFRKRGDSPWPIFGKFLLVTLCLLGGVQLIQYLLIDRLGWREFFGVALGMIFYTGVGYLINRLWVFKGPENFREDSV